MPRSVAGSDGCGSVSEVANKPVISPVASVSSCPVEPDLTTRVRRGGPSGGASRFPWLWGALCVAALPVFMLNPGIFVGETVNSRLATVYALIHEGTWYIDTPLAQPPNPFEVLTVDKVQASNGRMLSSKPPVLPLMMAGEYAFLHRVFGWVLTDQQDLKAVLRVMIASLIKVPHLIGLLFFALLLRMFVPDGRMAAVVLLFFALATPILGYSFQINNHTPSAAALCGALYFGLGVYLDKLRPSGWRFAAFGFCSAFVFVTDIPVTVFPATIGFLLLLKFRLPFFGWAVLGAAPLLVLHFALMTIITGSPLPVQTRESMFNFRNSYWRNPIGVDGLNEAWYLYLFHMTFGRFGTFVLFPILLFAVPGTVLGFKNHGPSLRTAVLSLLAAFILLSTYYILKTNNYGGAAYGFRWHIGAVPVLLFLASFYLGTLRSRWQWILVGVFALISLYSAWECLQAPWGASHEWTCRWIWGPVF